RGALLDELRRPAPGARAALDGAVRARGHAGLPLNPAAFTEPKLTFRHLLGVRPRAPATGRPMALTSHPAPSGKGGHDATPQTEPPAHLFPPLAPTGGAGRGRRRGDPRQIDRLPGSPLRLHR